MLRLHQSRKTFSADIKHRTFGRLHLALNTKTRATAMIRYAALKQLLDTGEPVRDLVEALRQRKLTIEAVTECIRLKRSFDTLRPSTWPTISDGAAAFVAEQEAMDTIAANTASGTAQALTHAVAFFGAEARVDDIGYEDVTAYKEHLKAQFAPNTVVLYLVKFGALFTFLQKRETRRALQARRTPFMLTSPLDREAHVPTKQQTRKRFLAEDEAERLLTVAPADFKAAAALGLFAGLRVGEVQVLRPGIDVDLDRGMIYVQARDGWQPKYGKNREIPITQALEPFLLEHMARLAPDAPWMFGGRTAGEHVGDTSFGYAFRRCIKDAELPSGGGKAADGVTFHTLRHTFASWLVMAGADLFTVARLMGHTSTTQVEATYAHLSPGHKLATVELLSARWLTHTTKGE